jgi:hypothetical protein
MPTLTESAEILVTVDYRCVGLLDVTCDDSDKPPVAGRDGAWLGTTYGNVYITNVGNEVVFDGHMRLETWDGPAVFDPGTWDRSDVITVDLPSGVLGVDQITMGRQSDVYRLPEGQVWHTRVAWRTDPSGDPDQLASASILVQFWPDEESVLVDL